VTDDLAITVGSGEPDDQLAPGTYKATLTGLSAKEITWENQIREVFEWVFAVPTEDDDGNPSDPIVVSGLSSRMTGPQSKTATFLVALLGPSAVQPGATFTTKGLLGKECLIQTDLNTKGYARVTGATPLPQSSAPKRPSNREAAGLPAAPEPTAKTTKAAAKPAGAPPVALVDDNEVAEPEADLPF
jgi:hypothetical protein